MNRSSQRLLSALPPLPEPNDRYTAHAIMQRLAHPSRSGSEPRTYVASLVTGDKAWDPTSSKGCIEGPAQVTYSLYADGGVAVAVEPR